MDIDTVAVETHHEVVYEVIKEVLEHISAWESALEDAKKSKASKESLAYWKGGYDALEELLYVLNDKF